MVFMNLYFACVFFFFKQKTAYDTVRSFPLRVNSMIGSWRGFVGFIKMMAVAMCDNTLTDTIAPAFCRKFTLEVTVSGSASAAATPVVLPASAGISGLKRRQNC